MNVERSVELFGALAQTMLDAIVRMAELQTSRLRRHCETGLSTARPFIDDTTPLEAGFGVSWMGVEVAGLGVVTTIDIVDDGTKVGYDRFERCDGVLVENAPQRLIETNVSPPEHLERHRTLRKTAHDRTESRSLRTSMTAEVPCRTANRFWTYACRR